MNSIEVLKLALSNSAGWTLSLIADMKDSPLTQPTTNGGNHPLWNLGHIVHSESNLLDGFILGKPNRFPELEADFAMGTTPSLDANRYPPMDELMARFEEIRSATLAHLETLSEADLDRKSHAPEEFGEGFSTLAGCFTAMCIHPMFHAGQVADARRAAGRQPMFGAPAEAESA